MSEWTGCTPPLAVRFAVRELVLAIVLLPLSFSALAVFAVPYQLTGRAARRATNEPDVAATAKVIAGVVIYGAWLTALGTLSWWLAWPSLALLLLPLLLVLGVAGLFAIERETAVADAVRAWLLLHRTGATTRERLRRRRSELADVLDEVGQWLGQPADNTQEGEKRTKLHP